MNESCDERIAELVYRIGCVSRNAHESRSLLGRSGVVGLRRFRAGSGELSEFCPRTTPYVLHFGTEYWPRSARVHRYL
jgi:hypothetical protein